MASILVLGGTRDIGHVTVLRMLQDGHRVTVLNRGHTPDELPAEVVRIRADRSRLGALTAAVNGNEFDLVLDTTTYDATNATRAVEAFSGRARRYVFVSTGQVYLVRAAIERPFHEADFDGPLIAEPEPGSSDHDNWRYGVEKRDAEGVFGSAWNDSGFPVTTLRLPIVASQRDPAGRVQAYVARLLDRSALIVPSDEGLRLRHVYVEDVALLISSLVSNDIGIGAAVNLSSGESLTLRQFIALLAQIVASESRIAEADRRLLEARALLPGCSPFSTRWMSELDNRRSLEVFGPAGLRYTAPDTYLEEIAADYASRWRAQGLVPHGYEQRAREIELLPGLT
jgi:nucleoside-diphosphate-sugar epimerase